MITTSSGIRKHVYEMTVALLMIEATLYAGMIIIALKLRSSFEPSFDRAASDNIDTKTPVARAAPLVGTDHHLRNDNTWRR